MPNKYNFNQFLSGHYSCIEDNCDAAGLGFEWPEEKQEEHFQAHQAIKEITKEVKSRFSQCQNPDCLEIFEFPSRRGKPPRYCPDCAPIMAVEAIVSPSKAIEKEINVGTTPNELNGIKIQTCRHCGNEFEIPVQRGRPRLTCNDCKAKGLK